MLGLLALLLVLGLIGGGIALLAYRRILRRAKGIERGLKMVPLLIHLPPASADTAVHNRDVREVMREKIAQAEVLYNLISGTATQGFKSQFYGQRHVALEIVAAGSRVWFYAAVPIALLDVVKQAIVTAYPAAKLEEVEDHNLFNPSGKIDGTVGGEIVLQQDASYPLATYKTIERDPLEALLNTLTNLAPGDGAGIQIMLRPAARDWVKQATNLVNQKRGLGSASLGFTPLDLARAAIKPPAQQPAASGQPVKVLSNLEQEHIAAIEEKTKHPGYEVLIRVLASAPTQPRAQEILRNVATSFALYDAPGLNGFKFIPATNIEALVAAFIFRFFPPELNHDILNSLELATLFHLPEAQFSPSAQVVRQASKEVDGPPATASRGLLFGNNEFRGVKKEVRLDIEDRRRHTYVIGQTGTGKSTLLENLAVQDMLEGRGLAFIDPHGDTAERLISMVPKNRVEDIVYFNPGDSEHPLGLNLFEFSMPEQKDFLIQEALAMLYKLYDPGHTGIIGPRYEHWFRNAALTLMSDPGGATFIEIPRVFTDANFLKAKFRYVTDPTVVDFWTKEMAQTSDYHKSEMLGWFVSKFGAFNSNTIMRNIIGQTKSAFDLRQIMDSQKILIVNLSKGKLGELNSQLLGMILVIKFQAAAMGRASVPETQRPDFCLIVDEFQNFSTDSFAAILSEARKYRLNLIVANQFIGQLSEQIKGAIFGNVGTIMSYRVGPEDTDFLVRQFAPAFDGQDLLNLPNYHAVIRLMVAGLPSQPFSITALPPVGVASPEMADAIKQLAAAKYGLPRAQVEAALEQRYVLPPPRLGSLAASARAAQAAPIQTPAASSAPIPAGQAAAPALAAAPASMVPAVPTPPVTAPPAAPTRVDYSVSGVIATPTPPAAPAVTTAEPESTLRLEDIVRDLPAPAEQANKPAPAPAVPPAAPAPQPVAQPQPAPPPAAPAEPKTHILRHHARRLVAAKPRIKIQSIKTRTHASKATISLPSPKQLVAPEPVAKKEVVITPPQAPVPAVSPAAATPAPVPVSVAPPPPAAAPSVPAGPPAPPLPTAMPPAAPTSKTSDNQAAAAPINQAPVELMPMPSVAPAAQQSASPLPSGPKLPPGEVYVDETGSVHTGQ